VAAPTPKSAIEASHSAECAIGSQGFEKEQCAHTSIGRDP
jgi:hypothetical protein